MSATRTRARNGEPETAEAPSTAIATRDAGNLEVVSGRAGGGISIRSIDELKWFCEQIAQSGMVPEHFRKKPHDVLVAVQWGFEIGVSPIQALSNIAVINGRASIWGDLVLGLLYSRPDIIEWVEEDDLKTIVEKREARCVIKRKSNPKPTVITYTLQMAQAAGLVDKETYQRHFPRMMQMRARAFAARNAAPDILKGLAVREEQPVEAWAGELPDPDAPPAIRQPRAVLRETPVQDAEVVDEGKDAPERAPEPEPERQAEATNTTAPSAAPAADGEQMKLGASAPRTEAAASATDGSGYVPPAEPTKATEACHREITLSGRRLFTGGVSNITLMKIVALVAKFDAAYQPGAALDALAAALPDETPVDWYHCDENQGRAFVDFLTKNI